MTEIRMKFGPRTQAAIDSFNTQYDGNKPALTTVTLCKAVGCLHPVDEANDFCPECNDLVKLYPGQPIEESRAKENRELTMAEKYPKYYKDVKHLTEVDVYQVHQLFDIDDPSGCIHHASKKLLLSGVRTGGKSKFQDIKEARDTLNRWLEINS